jgi:D-serine deaminase-like pyridoxal phosphate-dependent protein
MSSAPSPPGPSLARAALGFPGLESLETPQVVVDLARLDANIARAAALVPSGIAFKPHVKTHKSPDIFARQRVAGAVGATASKPGEAIVFLEAGAPEVTVAYPLTDPRKVRRVLEAAARRKAVARFTADSLAVVEALEAGADGFMSVPVLVELDTGLKRCGLDPQSAAPVELARRIATSPVLTFAGLFTHEGQSYAGPDPATIRATSRAARETMLRVVARLNQAGFDVPVVSMGSTPSLLADGGYEGVTEVRPGNYVFLDLTAIRLGLAQPTDLALGIVASVVSANDTYALIDAGSKTLSSDTRPHAMGGAASFGLVYPLIGNQDQIEPFEVRRLSEEHGWVAREGRDLPVGSKVLVLPNHSCVVANLVDSLTVLAAGAPPVQWPVAARGTIR